MNFWVLEYLYYVKHLSFVEIPAYANMETDLNISAKAIIAEDPLQRDLFDKTTKDLCSLKLRTNVARVPIWIETLLDFYNTQANHSAKCNHCVGKSVIRVKKEGGRRSILTITVYLTTGSVTIQGEKADLVEFEKRFDTIKDSCKSHPTPATPNRPIPLLEIAESDIDIANTPQPIAPLPLNLVSPKPGSSSELPPPKNLSQAPQLPQEQSVLIQSTPPPQPRTRPVPAPRGTRKAATVLPTQGGKILKNLELEFISLDKRVCSQLEQFQKKFFWT